jgi:hypothetical protein
MGLVRHVANNDSALETRDGDRGQKCIGGDEKMIKHVRREEALVVILLHRLEGQAGWLAIRSDGSSKASAPQLLRGFALRTYSACL